MDESAELTRIPLLHRAYGAVPLPPLVTATLLWVLLVGTWLVYQNVLGSFEGLFLGGKLFFFQPGRWPELLLLGLLAYCGASLILGARGCRRDLEALEGRLDGTDVERVWNELGRATFSRRGRWLSVTASVLLGLAILRGILAYEETGCFMFGEHDRWWIIGRELVLFAVLGQVIYESLMSAAFFSRLGREYLTVDVLHTDGLCTVARTGLRNALMLSVGASAVLLLMAGGEDFAQGAILVAGMIYSAAFAALLLPLRGLRDRIRQAKREEIGRVSSVIAETREAQLGGQGSAEAAGRDLQGLLAYREFVEKVREWPLNGATVTRFAVYLAIPLWTWAGSSMVDRAVRALLD